MFVPLCTMTLTCLCMTTLGFLTSTKTLIPPPHQPPRGKQKRKGKKKTHTHTTQRNTQNTPIHTHTHTQFLLDFKLILAEVSQNFIFCSSAYYHNASASSCLLVLKPLAWGLFFIVQPILEGNLLGHYIKFVSSSILAHCLIFCDLKSLQILCMVIPVSTTMICHSLFVL